MIARGGPYEPSMWLRINLALWEPVPFLGGLPAVFALALLLLAIALVLAWQPNRHPMRRRPAGKPQKGAQGLTELERDSMRMGGWR